MAILFVLISSSATQAQQIPTLGWQERSDWINVKTDVSPAAVGNGTNDDTAAIQAAFNLASYNTSAVIYLPPGTYRLTSTLTMTKTGVSVIGHGQTSILKWFGPSGAAMMKSLGGNGNRYIGLTWDGNNVAGIAMDHGSDTRESRIRYQHCAFLKCKDFGIRTGQGTQYTSEVVIENCLFLECGTGIAQLAWNDYNFVVTGCEFIDCNIGLNPERGNVNARNCRFERSKTADITWENSKSRSFRRCVSVGSKCFIITPTRGWGTSPLHVQDCYITGWTNPSGAIVLRKTGPNIIFDCTITGPGSGGGPAINLDNGGDITQQLVVSNNVGSVVSGLNSSVSSIPNGTRGPLINNSNFRFLKSSASVPSQVFDATANGAIPNDGNDDTVAIQNTINMAKGAGGGAIAYLPTGNYLVSSPLVINGGNYRVGGCGDSTKVSWTGGANSQVFQVQDPQNVTLESLRIAVPGGVNSTKEVWQTGTTATSRMTYDGVIGTGGQQVGGFWLDGLPAGSQVHLKWLACTTHFRNSSAATILGDYVEGYYNTVEGLSAKTGYLGILTFHAGNTTVSDNQDLVVSDMYLEQSQWSIYASGAADGRTGKITVMGDRAHTYPALTVQLNNYAGRFFYASQFDAAPTGGYQFIHSGSNPVDVMLTGCMIVGSTPTITMGAGGHFYGTQNRNNDTPMPNVAPGSLSVVAAALDDLRQLGRMDLALNFAEASLGNLATPAGNLIGEFEPLCAPGKRMDVQSGSTADGSNVWIYTLNSSNAQKWRIESAGSGYYRLLPQNAPTKLLEAAGSGTASGTNVQIMSNLGGNNQLWKLEAQTDGTYELIPKHATGLRLNVLGNSSSSGANVDITTDNSGTGQHWRLYLQ